MSTPTTPLPLSPLTVDELRRRRDDARLSCGYRCETVFEQDDDFEEFDLEVLRRHGRKAAKYATALDARTAAPR